MNTSKNDDVSIFSGFDGNPTASITSRLRLAASTDQEWTEKGPEGDLKNEPPSAETLIKKLDLLHADNQHRQLDEQRHQIRERMKQKFKDAPKTVLQKAEEKKTGIERCLEDTDRKLNEMLAFGNELITNIKVANEKREVLRRDYETKQRKDLETDLNSESIEAIARFNDIQSRWSELGALKEPMIMFEQMDEQKERIASLMRRKDEMIEECQLEIERMNRSYDVEQKRQADDLYCLVERVDNQIDLLRQAYRHHLNLLEHTIEEERKSIALAAAEKWNEFYDAMQQGENRKLDAAKEKQQFYRSEIERITRQQEEITRATRIRLEKDAQMLEWEVRNTRNQVLMNSEKLDYNYQVMQKRNDENIIVTNQQKRRVAKLKENISELKKRIQTTQTKADFQIHKLSDDIEKLHEAISELEKKRLNFRLANKKKFFSVWNINYEEIKQLILQVFDIDRILHEQQLNIEWQTPEVDLSEYAEAAKIRARRTMTCGVAGGGGEGGGGYGGSGSKKAKGVASINKKGDDTKSTSSALITTARSVLSCSAKSFSALSLRRRHQRHQASKASKTKEQLKQQAADIRLLRNILRRIADRGGFLIEEKLMEILEPYSEEQQTLVRVDNVFAALNIVDMKSVATLIDYFRPYTWCPNCMPTGVSRKQLEKVHAAVGPSQALYETDDAPLIDDTNVSMEMQIPECNLPVDNADNNSDTVANDVVNAAIVDVVKSSASVSTSASSTSSLSSPSSSIATSTTSSMKSCDNHYLVVEPALVLTALNAFTKHQLEEKQNMQRCVSDGVDIDAITSIIIDNATIQQYWKKFLSYIPKDQDRLWGALEHGLNDYLEVLKRRQQLDNECAFLRRQNAELKHLLQKFQV